MERKTFIVIAMSGGKMLCNPFACFCETHDEAHLHVGEFLNQNYGKKMGEHGKPLPEDTKLTSFDVDEHVIYVGDLPPELKESIEKEERGEDEPESAPDRCGCPKFGERCGMRDPLTNECRLTECQLDGSAPKLCAEPAEYRGPNSDPEGRVYRPEEVLFAVSPYEHADFVDVDFIVTLTLKSDWQERLARGEKFIYDYLGGHNVDNDALVSAGVNPAELMESIFEVNQVVGDNRDSVIVRMIDAGFGYLQSFQDWIDEFDPVSGD